MTDVTPATTASKNARPGRRVPALIAAIASAPATPTAVASIGIGKSARMQPTIAAGGAATGHISSRARTVSDRRMVRSPPRDDFRRRSAAVTGRNTRASSSPGTGKPGDGGLLQGAAGDRTNRMRVVILSVPTAAMAPERRQAQPGAGGRQVLCGSGTREVRDGGVGKPPRDVGSTGRDGRGGNDPHPVRDIRPDRVTGLSVGARAVDEHGDGLFENAPRPGTVSPGPRRRAPFPRTVRQRHLPR